LSYVREDDDFIHIGNSKIEVSFSKKNLFSIYSIKDKRHGIDLVKDKPLARTLWSVVPLEDDKIGKPITNLDSDSEHVDYVLEKGGKAAVIMRWKGVSHEGRWLKMGVTVTATIYDDEDYIDLYISIDNQEKICILKVYFPLVSGITVLGDDGEDDRLVYPSPLGYLVEDPWKTLSEDGDGWRDEDFLPMYPGNNGIQLLCLYREGMGGFYLTTLDDQGRGKGYYFLRKNNPSMNCFQMAILHYPDVIKYGNTIDQPYPLRIGVFDGGWENAAAKYRKWAEKQWWCSKGRLSEMKDLPDWLRKVGFAIFLHDRLVPLERVENGIKNVSEMSKCPFVLCWFDWRKVLVQGKYPDVKRIVKTAHAHNCYVYFYANARGWFEGFGVEPKEYLAVDWWGKPYTEINQYWSSFIMCPGTKFWRERLWKRWMWLSDQGVDGIYVDQVGCSPSVICFNKSHDHDPECGSWWVKKIHEIMGEGIDSRLLWGTEWQSEPYMDIFLFNWFWDLGVLPVWGVTPMFTKKTRVIPLFNFVYHEYNAFLGNPVPNAGGVITRLVRFSFDEYDDFTLGYDFITGKVPAMHLEVLEKVDPLRLKYLLRLGELRANQLNPYLFYGRMLKNPYIVVERTNVKMSSGHQFAPDLTGMRLYNVPKVLSSTWKAPDGSSAIIFTNWQNAKNSVKVTISPQDLQMKRPTSLYLLKECSLNLIESDWKESLTLNLHLEPYSIQAVIAKENPS